MEKIKKGDKVIVITGKDKNRTGSVQRVISKTKRVLVEGINIVKKHTKPNPQKNQQGGIVDKELPIHISNVALLNPATNKADRVGIKTLDDGRKVRYFKSNNEIIDVK
jgi:large subunit ribosomal protein L24